MAEYVKKEDVLALADWYEEYDSDTGEETAFKYIDPLAVSNLPAADVAPVVHGRWEYHDCVCTGDGLAAVYACSNCRFCIDEEVFEQLNATDFCNCCGARMDGAG